VYSVLIPQPITAFYRVVHVPAPVILAHVAERGVDAALGRDGVGAGGEELGDAGCFEAGFGETDGCAEAGAAGAYDDGVVVVIYQRVVEGSRGGGSGSSALGLA